ncbi:maleylpyruvate isomerase N-terminal domain-containing protein [Sediminibacterium sp.]|uniref:maleylpyruvate isomerase N-terminal domain-containing protein n=1 Tax=Sediminibacterium sp. TaxID=1917865 RepID=UPI00273119E5|nr:maleylpyruvate isomerase N-terminal domain-containing protein [Sediminibacterium sp.]MDP2421029.1 maleylpyruvate isomerase N-terminal domain-containing protein [Sediminibacterium sp.]
MQPSSFLKTVHLFMPLHASFIQLLKELEPADWDQPTLAKEWRVKDIVAHLLDTTIRGIAVLRDKHFGDNGPSQPDYLSLVQYINQLNANFIETAKRFSPALLIEFLELTGPVHAQLLSDLDPFEKAVFSVAWAGENESYNWFHVAREYTEKYHHQLQIREAVGKTEALMTAEFYAPFMQTFFLGLPYLLKNHPAPSEAVVALEVAGSNGAICYLQYKNGQWQILQDWGLNNLYARTVLPADIAWKLFTKGISPKVILPMVTLEGNQALATQMLNLIAVVA